jgi:hypothetical protein
LLLVKATVLVHLLIPLQLTQLQRILPAVLVVQVQVQVQAQLVEQVLQVLIQLPLVVLQVQALRVPELLVVLQAQAPPVVQVQIQPSKNNKVITNTKKIPPTHRRDFFLGYLFVFDVLTTVNKAYITNKNKYEKLIQTCIFRLSYCRICCCLQR